MILQFRKIVNVFENILRIYYIKQPFPSHKRERFNKAKIKVKSEPQKRLALYNTDISAYGEKYVLKGAKLLKFPLE